MNEFERLRRQADRMQALYPAGTRVLLIHMDDPYAPVPAGTRGTVDFVDDIGQLHMTWDNGRTLAIAPEADQFRKLTPQELAQEQQIEVTQQEMNRMEKNAAKRLQGAARNAMAGLDSQIQAASARCSSTSSHAPASKEVER